MNNSETTGTAREHQQVPAWKNKSFWHITILMIAFTAFYYMDVIINLGGWTHLKWKIFYTVHDLHRALFLIPAMYAAYEFRLRGIAVTSFLSLLIFLPRALVVSPYPDPLFRALIFMVSMVIMGVLLSKLLNNISEKKVLMQDLSQTQNDLLHIKAEEALREAEDKYKSLIDNIPDVIFTIDLEGKITFVSKRTKEILGYENEETINMNIFNFIPEEDHQRAIENLQKGMTGEKIRHFQIPMMAKSGERLIFDCSFSRIYKDGKVIGAQGTATDITERKQAEDQLSESLAKLQWTIDEAPVCVAMVGTDKRFLQCNKSFCDFLGYSAEDLKGKTIAEITFPDDIEIGMADLRAIMADEIKTSRVQKRYVRKDGSLVWGEVTISLIRDKNGNPLYFLPIIQDITFQKKAEEMLKASEDRFRHVFEAANVGKSITTPAGKITVNQAFADLLGYSKQELEGKTWQELTLPEDIDTTVTKIGLLLSGEQNATRFNKRYLHKNGSVVWADVSTALRRDKAGQPLHFVTTLVDISERKRFEDELLASEGRIRAVIDSTPFPIALVDVQDNNIEYWSRSALELFGHTAPTTPEWYQLAYPDPDYRREVIDRWKPFLETARLSGKSVNTGAYRVSCHDGSVRICELYATFMSNKLIVTFNDITERKQAESQREAMLEEISKFNKNLEQKVKERTAELNETIDLLEETNRVFVGRELMMIELKERIAELEKRKA